MKTNIKMRVTPYELFEKVRKRVNDFQIGNMIEHNRKIESIEFDLNMFKSSNKLREDLIEKLERDAKESIKDIKELESLNNVLKMENKSLKESSKISCNMLHSQKDKIDRLELNYVIEQSNYKKEIEKLKAVIEYLESKVK